MAYKGYWLGKKRYYKNPAERKNKISEGLKRAYANGLRSKIFSGTQGGFKKGNIPWNKGLPREQQPRFGKPGWNKGMKGYTNNGSIKRGENNLAIKACLKLQNSKEPTSIEKIVYNELKKREIIFEKQKLINNKFVVDIYIPSINLIIECDGNYWHSRERTIKKDKAENAYLTTCGFNLLRFPEHEINNYSFKERLDKIWH